MGKKAPKAPDPAVTAAAQGAWNSFTAQQQQALNMVGQDTPWGSLDYEVSGYTTIVDPNGKEVPVPMYTATTRLTPEQEAIFQKTQAAETNLAGIAETQSKKIGDLLNTPFEFNNRDAETWAYDLATERLLPEQERRRKALETQLVNKGIASGSSAWNTEMSRLDQADNDMLNQLALSGRQMAFNEAYTQRTQPLNEIIGLLSGTQVQNPNASFAQTPQTGVAGVDYSGLVNQKYQSEMNAYNARVGAVGGALGGLFSMFRFSDERLKENKERIGETDEGVPIYRYNYKGDPTPQIGVMAQDMAKHDPWAVAEHPSGALMVDYSRVH